MPAHQDDEHADRIAHHNPWEHHDGRLPVDPDLAPDDPAEPSVLHHPIPHVHRAREHDVLAAIAAGGFLGALGRYEVGLAWPTPAGHVPWATFAINISYAVFCLKKKKNLMNVLPLNMTFFRIFVTTTCI